VRAEPRINAVIVRDRRERMPIYARLIQALDVDTPLVEIEASVIDINSEKAESLGVDWRAHTRRVDVAMSPNDLSRTGLRPVEPLLSGGPGLVGTVLLGNERSYFLSRVNALADRGDARLLARPRVLTTDNSEAVLSSTRDFYVRVAGRDEVDLFNVSLGLKLRVTPALVDDPEGRRFRLIVHIEDGSASDSSAVDQIPVVSRNAISTQAVIGDGQSLLIGGYTIETRRNDQVGLPGVGSVPVLGWLFGQRSQTNTRVERMFLITPRLVQRAAPQGRVEEPAPGGAGPSAPPAGPAAPPGR
jgi:type III secretion protein C